MFRAPGPAGLPSFTLLLQDLQATPAQICRHLGVTARTLQRWRHEDAAPRAVMLALFWETRWGRSAADCEAANWAALHYRRAIVAEREAAALRRHLAALELALVDGYGAANAPRWRAD